ncbi:MAG TPA: AprI/Inh family metalloprotease inhibitor [Xanthobacteraceae bacterium]|jgi:hypothetical protein
MPRRVVSRSLPVTALATASLVGFAPAQTAPTAGETAKEMVGAWEISNAARDKICPLTFSLDAAPGGLKLELDPQCSTAFPALKDVVAWAIGPNDAVRLFDSKGALILDFGEVESRMYEAERKGEGLFFMRTQAAVKAATVNPEQVFGEWALLQEFEKPLCRLTLSNTSDGNESYKVTIKPGCVEPIAGFGLTSWRLVSNELLLTGRGGTWRFSESDTDIWERVPPSTDPLLLMKQ